MLSQLLISTRSSALTKFIHVFRVSQERGEIILRSEVKSGNMWQSFGHFFNETFNAFYFFFIDDWMDQPASEDRNITDTLVSSPLPSPVLLNKGSWIIFTIM